MTVPVPPVVKPVVLVMVPITPDQVGSLQRMVLPIRVVEVAEVIGVVVKPALVVLEL